MGSVSPFEAERQKIDRENKVLFKHIRKKNKDLVEDIQIARIEDKLIALYRPKDTENISESADTVYRVHPIKSTGEINDTVDLIIKETTQQKKSSQWQHTIPSELHDKNIMVEAKNDNALFSSRVAILAKESADKIIYEKVILMSKVAGVPLHRLIHDPRFKALTAAQRTRLAINIIKVYEILHAQGILHRDVKAENILVDLDTLQAMPVDIDPSRNTKQTAAPEPEITEKSDICSLAQDALTLFFSGVRPEKNDAGEITNVDSIKNGIRDMFISSGLDMSVSILIDDTNELLKKLQSKNPDERGTLQEAREALEALASSIEKATPKVHAKMWQTETEYSAKRRELYQAQLYVLDTILEDPLYAIDPQNSNHQKPSKNSNSFFKYLSETKQTLSKSLHFRC